MNLHGYKLFWEHGCHAFGVPDFAVLPRAKFAKHSCAYVSQGEILSVTGKVHTRNKLGPRNWLSWLASLIKHTFSF